jgi:cytochrome c-type biogenesis protein CcsB
MPAVDPGLASLSDTLLLAAIAAYALAMFGYTIEYAFGVRAATRPAAARPAAARPAQAQSAQARVLVGAGAPVPEQEQEEPVEPAGRDRLADRAGQLALLVTAAAVALQIGSITTRGLAAHRIPFGNMYEFISGVCAVGVVAWIVLAVRRPVRHLGAFVMPVVLMMLGIAGSLLYTDAAPLMPALNSYWRDIHVPAAITASGLFLVGFVLAVLYLVRDHADRKALLSGRPAPQSRLPEAAVLERLTFRVHAIAFPIWTVAIILGALWAEAAWSRYWGWDPKETWAFISWVIYAAYLHARSTAGWRGRGAALVAVVGWATMLFNLFAINLVYSGLHSYSGL